MRIAVMGVLLFGTWLMWSGHFEPLLLAFGVFSVVAVIALDLHLERHADLKQDYRLGLRWLGFVPWLLWEIVKANLEVAKLILDPSLPLCPRLISLKMAPQSELGKVILANSVTLTPGTVTLDLRGDTMLVHALTKASAAGLVEGTMNERVAALEEGRPA